MASIRPFVADDIPQVATLHRQAFGDHGGHDTEALESYLADTYLDSPWRDEKLPSFVHEGSGDGITGFLGIMPRRMTLNGKPLRVAIAAQMMVEPDSRTTMAGVELVRHFLSGPQDLSLADGATDAGRRLYEAFGGVALPLYSLYWTRPLRPGRYAVSTLRQYKSLWPLRILFRPLSYIVDSVVTSKRESPFYLRPSGISAEEASESTVLDCLSGFSTSYALRPQYDADTLHWLLRLAGGSNHLGELRRIVMRNDERESVGWYLYYRNRGGVGEVLQFGAKYDAIGQVLDHLFYDAWRHGVLALRGRLDPRYMSVLSDKKCFFRRGLWLLAHSTHPELLQACYRGDAFLSRLDGEWCLRANELTH